MDTLRIYGSAEFGWRWRMWAANNRVVAASSEEFRDRNKCIANAARVLRLPEDLSVRDDGCVVFRSPHPPLVIQIAGRR